MASVRDEGKTSECEKEVKIEPSENRWSEHEEKKEHQKMKRGWIVRDWIMRDDDDDDSLKKG